jgi:signal transduction histidine kinase
VSIGALVVLELVQIPLAWSLARQLRQRSRQREGLLRQTLETSDVERRRIASDLHDGVVQDLAGVAFSLGAAARSDGVQPAQAKLFEDSAVAVRDSIKALRSLLVEIYPPNLFDEGLDAALSDLLGRASGRGVEATLDTSGLAAPLPPHVAGLLYRTAQEALRNVFAHARARSVRVAAATGDGLATLTVVDDGVGFDPAHAPQGVSSGHFGLAGLRQLVTDAGGRVQVQSAVGTGTTVRVEVPL